MVYAIRAPGSDLIYYGSTIQALSQRMAGHRDSYKRHSAGKNVGWCSSYQLLALTDAYIELVRVIEFNVRAELHAAERLMIRENECVNKVQAGRTAAQYRIDHVEEKAESDAARYAANVDAFRVHNAEYRAANIEKIKEKHDCKCGGCYTTAHKAQHIKTITHQTWLATQ
jgi:hypothetical protein